jgi:hypothetical protein
MTKLVTGTRLVRLAAVLVTTVALTALADVANAKNHDRHDGNGDAHYSKDHHADGMTKKESRRERKREKKEKYAEKKRKKECLVIISGGGSPCGGKKPTQPGGTTTGNPTKPGGTAAGLPKNPPGYVTISNGVKTITVPDVPGQFSAAWSNAGGIDVHVGNQTYFFQGPSVTVTGEAMSTSLAQRGGLQEVGISKAGVPVNEVTVSLAIAPSPPTPAPSPAPAPTKSSGGGDGVIVGTLKDIGNGIEDVGLGFINLGGPTPKPPQTGTITQQ